MDELILLIVLLVAGGVVWAIRQSATQGRTRELRRAALESDAVRHYYQQALQMARVLDRLERDDMIAVTIPGEMRAQIRTMVETFFGEGDDPRALPR